MEDSEENMSSDGVRKTDSPSAVKKPKKRSLVERELETSLTARVTSPASVSDGLSTSRYGRARRLKTEAELIESQKSLLASIKTPGKDKTPVKVQSPTYRMHASNSPQKAETPKNPPSSLENQIDNIYQENASLSRFAEETGTPSPAKKFPKVYIRKDMIQNREEDEPIMLISNLFSPTKSSSKTKTPLSNNSVQSSEKYNPKQNGLMDTSSVVKTLDFDSNKKKKKDHKEKEQKVNLSKNELFEVEAKCPYQLGDLAWARMGTFPFWPCIVTRDPQSEMFVKKKLFGRVEHNIIHVTFFGDNGRRSWVVDNMLREYLGLNEFETTKEKFTPEDKKKDPRLYAAFFISEKKQPLWNASVEEAECLLREPKRLRIDIFNDMLWKTRLAKKTPKSGKIMTRTDSDVSLSESLYDSLFSEQEEKTDDVVRTKNRSRHQSFDVSDVVTACLDNMATKTGITKIQRQSHMDRWLQKAKSKTPEKKQTKIVPLKVKKPEQKPIQNSKTQPKITAKPIKLNRKSVTKAPKSFVPTPPLVKPYRFRRRAESYPTLIEPGQVPSDSKTEDTSNLNSILKTEDTKSTSIDDTVDIDTEKPPTDNHVITNDADSCDAVHTKKEKKDLSKNTIQDSDTIDSMKSKSANNQDKTQDESAMSVDDDSNNVSQTNPEAKEDINNSSNISNSTDKEIRISSIDKSKDAIEDKSELKADDTASNNDELQINTDISIIELDIKTDSMKNNTIYKKTKKKTLKSFNNDIVDKSLNQIVDSNTSEVIDIHNQQTNNKDVKPSCVTSHDLKIKNKPEEPSKTIIAEKIEDCIMEIDNANENDKLKTHVNETEELNIKEAMIDSVMEVDNDNNFEIQTNGNASLMSEIVSSKIVEHNEIVMACTDTNLKDARNVTIEVSVTEKENDDTLNNQLHDEQQESIDKQALFQDFTTNDQTTFLDTNHKENMSIIDPKNSSTPEKLKEHLTVQSSNTCSKKLDLDMTANDNCNEKESESQIEPNKCDTTGQCENQCLNDKGIDVDLTIDEKDDLLNQSTQSESILLNPDDVAIDEKKTDTSFNDSLKSESILDHSLTEQDEFEANKTSKNLANDSNFDTKENNSGSTRSYVESPTFTQLLESEEFFRDENDHPGPPKLDTKDDDKENKTKQLETKSKCGNINPEPEIIRNDDILHCQNTKHGVQEDMKHSSQEKDMTIEIDKVTEAFDEELEESSDDEPSPEYESLDEEITEDFRKHMLSIKSNIKDKKDEDQLVKICNEIAEKAKLSPTKYMPDEQVIKQADTKVKSKPLSNINDKLEIDTNVKQKLDTQSTEKSQLISNKKNSKLSHDRQSSLKELMSNHDPAIIRNHCNNYLNVGINKLNIHEKRERIARHSKDSKPSQMNGNATLKEITDSNKPKISNKTRRSMSNAMRNLSPSSFGFKIEASKIEQYRKSAEYAPTVLLTRLEQDQLDCDLKIIRPMYEKDCSDNLNSPYNKDTSKNDETVSLKDSVSNTNQQMDTNIVGNCEERTKPSKSRLSLKKDSPRNKKTENKSMIKQPELKTEELTPHSNKSFDKEVKTTVTEHQEKKIVGSNLEPTKVDLENVSNETKIPETIKINGLDRKYTATPDSGDTDFDIDAVSLNSEDSEISLPNSIESIPKRNLRSRPERTLENALKNPEFLKYLELKQDYLMDEHPELNEDEVIMYVYKTWQYEEDLKSDNKKSENARHQVKGVKNHETPRSHKKKSQPKNSIENYFREKYEKSIRTIDFVAENECLSTESNDTTKYTKLEELKSQPEIMDQTDVEENLSKSPKTRSITPEYKELTLENSNDTYQTNNSQVIKNETVQENYNTVTSQPQEIVTPKNTHQTPKRNSRRSKPLTPTSIEKELNTVDSPENKLKKEKDFDTESVDSEEIPLRKLRSKAIKENDKTDLNNEIPDKTDVTETKQPTNDEVKREVYETTPTVSDNEVLVKQKKKTVQANSMEDPEFLKYLELKQDALMDENPQLSQDEIVSYLYKTWLYEESTKTELEKDCESEPANLIVGLNNNDVATSKKVKRRSKFEKQTEDTEVMPKAKPRRRIAQPFYNENFSDIEDELELFEIFKTKKTPITVVSKTDNDTDKTKSPSTKSVKDIKEIIEVEKEQSQENDIEEVQTITQDANAVQYVDETEVYFADLTKPKPNVFKGLTREKVCEICEYAGHLVKCKGCHGMFHPDCVKRELEASAKEKKIEPLQRGRKKKIKKPIRKTKSFEDSGSDEKQDASADVSMEDITIPEITFDADKFESELEVKMKALITTPEINYDSYSSDDGIDWRDTEAGKCEIVDVKWKRRDAPIDYSDFKCKNCLQHNMPICYVCKNAVSKTGVKMRQKCHVAHCHKYYHLECLDHWPQTQFNSGEPSKHNKKVNAHFEAITCPRHVCHTCVSDDPRGCKTRFSGDKLAKCVRCPATYHSFNKCLPAGSQLLTASHIICPRHCDQRPGKVPCHVNTGWCFICALGGSLICCEYCPTSFHAECLNIKPPEGNYMCEDCETGRLPLYGEMVWVKLGHYRWWPGIILHPSEIPENIMAVKHEPGDFVVRFFGQYDHYWVNRGRVFPYQEGDSGRISSQKSKINEDFICAMEHAQRAYNILKNAEPDEDESLDIESSLLPPHYVKLKCNKPCGSVCARRTEDPSLSLTQCECDPNEREPCGPYSQCLNRMLLTECGPTCRAGDRCMNRAFEKRQYPKLVPYRTPHRGWGLKTLDDIKAGQFVIEYVGELIDEEEFRRRMRRKHEIRDENFYFLTLDKERMIDAGPKGNVARFMNHCCEPNCETQKWTVLGDVRVGLFAINDIPANSEVTFNYNLECAGIEKKRCLCGAKRCSGYIGAKPKQDDSQTKKPKRPYNKKKKPEESPSTNKIKTKRLGRPPKPKELTELEKDVLIIKNATSSISSDDSSKTTCDDKIPKPLKKKRTSNVMDEIPLIPLTNGQEVLEEKTLKKKRASTTDDIPISNSQELNSEEKVAKALKRKRVSIAMDEVSICNGLEPSVKKQKCDEKPSEVGD